MASATISDRHDVISHCWPPAHRRRALWHAALLALGLTPILVTYAVQRMTARQFFPMVLAAVGPAGSPLPLAKATRRAAVGPLPSPRALALGPLGRADLARWQGWQHCCCCRRWPGESGQGPVPGMLGPICFSGWFAAALGRTKTITRLQADRHLERAQPRSAIDSVLLRAMCSKRRRRLFIDDTAA